MEAQRQAHPTARQLAAFALEKLTPDGQRRMQEHLASCESCAAFIAGAPHDTLVNLLRQAASNVSSSDQATPAVRDSSTLSSIVSEKPAKSLSSPPVSSSAPQAAPAAQASSGEAGSVRQPADESIPLPLREQTKYRIGRLLGRGGMGAVYEAYHERMARKVALKIIAAPLLAHPDALKRFEQEVRAAANLDHPNLARAFDADVFGDLHVLVMEYVTGRSLDRMLVDAGPMSIQQACQCALQTAQGLQHAHQRGMVHRDLKPANLMLTTEGRIKILDFGLAKLNQEQSPGSGLTRDHALMGTPAYLAPEQALDAAKADIRADVYSLGCTLYALLTGEAPFVGDTEMKILLAHQNEQHRPLTEVRPDVPRELSDLVGRMLAKNPSDRPQAPADVAQALLPFARGAAALPSPPVVSQPVPALATVEVPLGAASSRMHGARATTTAHPGSNSLAGVVRRVPPLWRWAGIALAGFILAVWAAVIMLRTPTGTIVVERVPADAEVLVDGEVVTLKRAGEEVTIAAVTQGDHILRLTRDGHDLWANDVSIRFAGEEVRVRHLPPGATPQHDITPAEASANKGLPSQSVQGNVVDFLSQVKLDRDGIRGAWRATADGIACTGKGPSRLRLPYRPPAEYDFAIEFTINALGKESEIAQFCVVGPSGCAWGMGEDQNTTCKFNSIDRRRHPPEYKRQQVFSVGKRYRSVVSIRNGSIAAKLNDEEICRFAGTAADLTYDDTRSAGIDFLGVGASSDVTFHRIEVTEISGPGRQIERLDPAKVAAQSAAFASLKAKVPRSLTDFAPRAWVVGWANLAQDFSPDQHSVVLDQHPCDKYLFAHAPSSVLFEIPDGAIAFRATGTGTTRSDVSVAPEFRFVVYVDDREAFISDVVQFNGKAATIEVPLPAGSRRLKLCTDALLNSSKDTSVWANPEFLFVDEASAAKAIPTKPQVTRASTARRVDLLSLVDPEKDALAGEWAKADGVLSSKGNGRHGLAIPYTPPAEYDVRVVFVPYSDEFFAVVCKQGDRQFMALARDALNRVCGFSQVDNVVADLNTSGVYCPTRWQVQGREYEFVVRVQAKEATIFLDGIPIARAPVRHLSLEKKRIEHRADVLELCLGNACDIKVLEVYEFKDKGKVLREVDTGLTNTDDGQMPSSAAKQTARSSPTASNNQSPPPRRTRKFDRNLGKWERVNDEVRQTSLAGAGRLLLGDKKWSRYVLTLQARLDEGEEGFTVYCHLQPDSYHKLQCGCIGNTKLKLHTNVNHDSTAPEPKSGTIEADRWYDVEIMVDNGHIRCQLDGKKIFDRTENRLKAGQVAIGSVKSAVRFRNIKVTSLDGKRVLWERLPTIPSPAAATHPDDDSPDGTTDEPEGGEEPPASQSRIDRNDKSYVEPLVYSHGAGGVSKALVTSKIRDHGMSPRSEY